MIVRALDETAKRHDELDGDVAFATSIRKLLAVHFGEELCRLAFADRLRNARGAGYNPPASGATAESIESFIRDRATAEAVRRRVEESEERRGYISRDPESVV